MAPLLAASLIPPASAVRTSVTFSPPTSGRIRSTKPRSPVKAPVAGPSRPPLSELTTNGFISASKLPRSNSVPFHGIFSDVDDLGPLEPDYMGLVSPNHKRVAQSTPRLNKTARQVTSTISRQPISLQSSTASNVDSTELPSIERLFDIAVFDELAVVCLLCAGEHLTLLCRKEPRTIGDTNRPFWVDKTGIFAFTERGSGQGICGSYNANAVCPRAKPCKWAHLCTLCGEPHQAKRCPTYRQTQLVQWWHTHGHKINPISPHPLVSSYYRLSLKSGAVPPAPAKQDTFIYTTQAKVYAHLPKVEIRNNHRLYVSTDDIIKAAPAKIQGRVGSFFARLCHVPSQETFTADRAYDIEQEHLNHARIYAREQEKIDAGLFTSEQFSCKGVDDRRQLPDGSPTAAPILLLLHYPSGHTDNVVLTDRAPATRVIRAHGIAPPSPDSPSLLAVHNVFPIKMAAEYGQHGGIRVRKAPETNFHPAYPKDVIDISVNQRITEMTSWFHQGKSKLVVMFGHSQHTFDVASGFKEAVNGQADVTEFRLAFPVLKDWEVNVEGPELSVIRQDCLVRKAPFPADPTLRDPLYPHTFRLKVEGYARSEQYGLDTEEQRSGSIIFSFSLISHKNRDSDFLLVSSPHPETCSHKITKRAVAQQLDMVLDLVRNLLQGTTGVTSFPACSTLAQVSILNEFANLKTYFDIQAGTEIHGRSRLFVPEVLPPAWQALARHVDQEEVGSDHQGENDIVFKGKDDTLELVSFALNKLRPATNDKAVSYDPTGLVKHPARNQSLQVARKTRSDDVMSRSSTCAVADVPWDTVCCCGLPGTSILLDKATRVPLLVRKRAGTLASEHPANSERNIGTTCLSGVPLDPVLLAKALLKVDANKNGPISASVMSACKAAIVKYESGQGAAPLSPGTWRALSVKHNTKKGKGKQAEKEAGADEEAEDDLDSNDLDS